MWNLSFCGGKGADVLNELANKPDYLTAKSLTRLPIYIVVPKPMTLGHCTLGDVYLERMHSFSMVIAHYLAKIPSGQPSSTLHLFAEWRLIYSNNQTNIRPWNFLFCFLITHIKHSVSRKSGR